MITLTVASGTGVKGNQITLAVNIASTGGDQCTALQWSFSLTSDVALVSVTAGAAAIAAGKTLSRAGNLCAISSLGLNNNVIGDGVLVMITLSIAANPSTGSIPVSLTGIIATDATPSSLSTSGVDGTITVDSPVLTCPVGSSAGIVGTAYSATLVASGGTPPYTYSITG